MKEVIDKSFDGAGDRRRAYSMTDKCYVHFWYVCDKRCEMVYLQQRERERTKNAFFGVAINASHPIQNTSCHRQH